VGQESVSETSTGGSTSGQTGDIDTGEVGGDSGSGLVGLAQPVVSLVGDEDTSLLGVDGGIGEVGSVGKRGLQGGKRRSKLEAEQRLFGRRQD